MTIKNFSALSELCAEFGCWVFEGELNSFRASSEWELYGMIESEQQYRRGCEIIFWDHFSVAVVTV
jgi:hypothetical protein